MAHQLFNLIKPVATDRGIRAVLLRGQGGNFMAGLDMNLYADVNFELGIERVH
jgi:enoyl-CoA hydratase/carnithine racemase